MDAADRLKAQGNARFQQQDYAGALALYGQSLEANSANPIAHSNRAMCLIKLQRPREALQACQAGLALLGTAAAVPNLERLRQKLEYRLQLAQQQLQGPETSKGPEQRRVAIHTVERLPEHLAQL